MRTIQLINGLGQLEVSLPINFDTLHTWVSGNDYSCGDLFAYRFQSSTDSIWEEGQFISILPEKYYFFTVFHEFKTQCNDSIADISVQDAKEIVTGTMESLKMLYKNESVVISEVVNSNHKIYAVIGTIDTTRGFIKQSLTAYTIQKGDMIKIVFDSKCETLYSDGQFLDKSLHILKGIRFRN